MVVLGLGLAGCSGARSEQILDDPTAMSGAPTSREPATSSPASPPSAAKTPSNATPSEKVPAPATTPPTEAPEPPPAPCTPELEPNDDPTFATMFTTRACGAISDDLDVDYVAFEAPKSAKAIFVSHSEKGGAVSYRYFVGGVQVPSLGGDTEPLLAIHGVTYTVQARSAQSGARPTYEIDVTFQ